MNRKVEKETVIKYMRYAAFKGIPAISTFVGVVGLAVDFQYTTLTITVLSGLSVMFGQLIGDVPITNAPEKIEEVDKHE